MKSISTQKFRRGDKVLLADEEEMIGTVKSALKNGEHYLVEFFVPGRKKGGYFTDLEVSAHELLPCYIDLNTDQPFA